MGLWVGQVVAPRRSAADQTFDSAGTSLPSPELRAWPPAGADRGSSESDPRARSNTEGPIGTAPRVRLIHGLQRTKELTTSAGDHILHFQPGTGRPPGGQETNPKIGAGGVGGAGVTKFQPGTGRPQGDRRLIRKLVRVRLVVPV